MPAADAGDMNLHASPTRTHARPWLMGLLLALTCVGIGFVLGVIVAHPKPTLISVTPTSCMTALADADRAFGLTEDRLKAVADHRPEDVADLNAQLDALAPRYLAAKTACRSSR